MKRRDMVKGAALGAAGTTALYLAGCGEDEETKNAAEEAERLKSELNSCSEKVCS
jgi:outer membrane murein-binding lipoprotein Lpp